MKINNFVDNLNNKKIAFCIANDEVCDYKRFRGKMFKDGIVNPVILLSNLNRYPAVFYIEDGMAHYLNPTFPESFIDFLSSGFEFRQLTSRLSDDGETVEFFLGEEDERL